MNHLILILFSAISLSIPAIAQTEFARTQAAETESVTLPKVKGVVRRIDTANAKISIKHEAIPNLDMPAMTMTFAAREPSMTTGLAVGNRILFSADELNGVLTVVWLEKQP